MFGWDKVNFDKKPGGDIAGTADTNWPNKRGIRYHTMSCTVLSVGAGQREFNHGWGAHWASGGERKLLCVFPCFCIFFLSVLLLLQFTSFAVLLNCPYPKPQVLPFPFNSSPQRGRGVIELPHSPLLPARAKP